MSNPNFKWGWDQNLNFFGLGPSLWNIIFEMLSPICMNGNLSRWIIAMASIQYMQNQWCQICNGLVLHKNSFFLLFSSWFYMQIALRYRDMYWFYVSIHRKKSFNSMTVVYLSVSMTALQSADSTGRASQSLGVDAWGSNNWKMLKCGYKCCPRRLKKNTWLANVLRNPSSSVTNLGIG